MSVTKFILADGTSAALSVVLMVGVGYWGGNRLQVWRRDVIRIEYVATLVFSVLWGGGWMLFRYLGSQRKSSGQ